MVCLSDLWLFIMIVYKEISKNRIKTCFYLTIFAGLLLGIGWFFSYYYDNPEILVIAAVLSVGFTFFSYWFSDRIILHFSGAKHIAQKRDFPELYRIVENLVIAAGLPMPKIYVIDDPSPNAFATGRDPKHSVVAVTRGLLEILDKSELEGVIAHELSHIGNRDMLVSAVVAVLVSTIGFVSDFFIRMSSWGERMRDDRKGRDIMFLVGFIGLVLAPIAAMLIQLAISRKREFLADANAVLITRYPDGLIRALEKISRSQYMLRYAHQTTAHLYFASPFKSDSEGDRTPWFVRIFSTHPPISERIKVLKQI